MFPTSLSAALSSMCTSVVKEAECYSSLMFQRGTNTQDCTPVLQGLHSGPREQLSPSLVLENNYPLLLVLYEWKSEMLALCG